MVTRARARCACRRHVSHAGARDASRRGTGTGRGATEGTDEARRGAARAQGAGHRVGRGGVGHGGGSRWGGARGGDGLAEAGEGARGEGLAGGRAHGQGGRAAGEGARRGARDGEGGSPGAGRASGEATGEGPQWGGLAGGEGARAGARWGEARPDGGAQETNCTQARNGRMREVGWRARCGDAWLAGWGFLDDVCDDGGCPTACAAVDPQPVAAAPLPRRVVVAVPRSTVAPRSRGQATAGLLCGQAAASPGPRGGNSSKVGEQAASLDVRVATAKHEARGSSGVMEGARFERRHGRREVRATMIAVTSSDPA
eukprot:XP_020401071.1 glycine-rich cell wall structural protein 1-like [Zea mays]